jgi:hypothetical protein
MTPELNRKENVRESAYCYYLKTTEFLIYFSYKYFHIYIQYPLINSIGELKRVGYIKVLSKLKTPVRNNL